VYLAWSIEKPAPHFSLPVSLLVDLEESLAMRKRELERLKKRSPSVSDN
jgi:hypothetical protein